MGVSWVSASEERARRPMAAQIEREFSGVVAWYGEATGAWWAMVRIRCDVRLVEALDPGELRDAIAHAGVAVAEVIGTEHGIHRAEINRAAALGVPLAPGLRG